MVDFFICGIDCNLNMKGFNFYKINRNKIEDEKSAKIEILFLIQN